MPLRRAILLRVPSNIVLIVASALGYYFFNGLRTFAVTSCMRNSGSAKPLPPP